MALFTRPCQGASHEPARVWLDMGKLPKRVRSDAEVGTVAARLAGDWTPGDAVATWMRRHVEDLTRLIHVEGWSWADVARALDTAGIAYRSGRPWTGFMLARKVAKFRADARARATPLEASAMVAGALREALSGLGGIQNVVIHVGGSSAPSAPAPAATRTSRADQAAPARSPQSSRGTSERPAPGPGIPAVMHEDDLAAEPEPVFAPARPIGWTPAAKPAPAEEEPPPSPPPDVDFQGVLERFLNKPKR